MSKIIPTHKARVRRTDPKLKGGKLEFYHVKIAAQGANWVTEGGVVFGGATGKLRKGDDKELLVYSIQAL